MTAVFALTTDTVADPGFPNGGAKDEAPQAPRFSRRRREDRGAEGAEVERRRREDRGAEGAEGGGEGCPPPHWGRGLGRGLCPLPRKFLIFHL